VPKQANDYDCGVFVIKFVEMILEKWPTTTPADIQEKLKSQFQQQFTQADIHDERENIQTLLDE
jgi:Ulp1 family protease